MKRIVKEAEHPDTPSCLVSKGCLNCTLAKGHSGNHIATGIGHEFLEEWPNESEDEFHCQYCTTDSRNFCRATVISNSRTWTCTRPKHHSGPHIACVPCGEKPSAHSLHSWSDKYIISGRTVSNRSVYHDGSWRCDDCGNVHPPYHEDCQCHRPPEKKMVFTKPGVIVTTISPDTFKPLTTAPPSSTLALASKRLFE